MRTLSKSYLKLVRCFARGPFDASPLVLASIVLCLGVFLSVQATSQELSAEQQPAVPASLVEGPAAPAAKAVVPIADLVRNIESGMISRIEGGAEASMELRLEDENVRASVLRLLEQPQTAGSPFARQMKSLVGFTIGDAFTIISTEGLQETRVVRFDYYEEMQELAVVCQPAKETRGNILIYRGTGLPNGVRLHEPEKITAKSAHAKTMRKVIQYLTGKTPPKHRKGLKWLGINADDMTYVRGNFGGDVAGHVVVHASDNKKSGMSMKLSARLVLDAAGNVTACPNAPAIKSDEEDTDRLEFVLDLNGDGIDELIDYSGSVFGGCTFIKYWDGTTTVSKKLGCWSEA